MSDTILYLNEKQVVDKVKEAEDAGNTITVRCKRKTAASKTSQGADKGDFFDLVCGPKPKDYVPAGTRDRRAEDQGSGVLTVFATNRPSDKGDGSFGAWRRVNVREVIKIIYLGQEWAVTHTDATGKAC